jgi:hypothetical protein
VVSFSSVTTNESGAYDVVISNAGGSLTSAVVNVTVDPAVFRTDVGADFREPAPKPGWQYLQSNFRNGTELFHVVAAADTLPQASGTFNVQSLVSAGDTLSFVVGIKGNLYGDETAVRGSISIAAPSAIRLTLVRDGSEVLLNWTGGQGPYQVQQTTTLDSTCIWENVGEPVRTNSMRMPCGPGNVFLRVRGQ